MLIFVSITVIALSLISTTLSLKCPGDDDLPEAKMNASHRIITDDGYILTIHRILTAMNGTTNKPVIFLQHGLASSSTNWFLNLPNQSLPFILADLGYDVWLGNHRGNSYSKEHVTLFKNESSFWDFSWENIAEYDLPAMINYVLNFTKSEQLVYIGHSQGTLIAFAKFSTDFNLAKKIKLFIALGPVSTVGDIKSHFKYLVPFTWSMQSTFFITGYFSLNDVHRFTKYVQFNASAEKFTLKICRKISLYLSGIDATTIINQTRIPIFLGHIPDDTSMKNVVHYGQMVISGRMQRYDYGFIKNYLVYNGSFYPPEYKLDNFNVKTVVFWSPVDELASGNDIHELLGKLKNARDFKIDNFRHFDFLLSLEATELVYFEIVNILKETFESKL